MVEAAVEGASLAGAEAVFLGDSLSVRAVSAVDGRRVPIRADLLDRLRAMSDAQG